MNFPRYGGKPYPILNRKVNFAAGPLRMHGSNSTREETGIIRSPCQLG